MKGPPWTFWKVDLMWAYLITSIVVLFVVLVDRRLILPPYLLLSSPEPIFGFSGRRSALFYSLRSRFHLWKASRPVLRSFVRGERKRRLD